MLADRLPKDRRIVGAEVGVWRGDMASRMLRLLPRLTLILVDRWQAPPAGDSYHQGSTRIARMPQADFDAALDHARLVVAPYTDRVHWLIGDSSGMAGAVDDASLDFAFIDADHSYAGCRRDIEAWLPKVKRGGLLGGHDYGKADQGDVAGAVRDTLGRYDVEVGEHTCWWVRP